MMVDFVRDGPRKTILQNVSILKTKGNFIKFPKQRKKKHLKTWIDFYQHLS